MNALAATAASLAMDVDMSDIVFALESYTGMKGRLQFLKTGNGACVIDDTYNANPYSLGAAIDVLVALKKDAWLVLGDMGELGQEAAQLHRQAGIDAKKSGVKRLFATGDNTRYAVEGFGEGAQFFADKQSLATTVSEAMSDQTTVLVKGSRGMRMEEIVSVLMASGECETETDEPENSVVKN